jgi:hypothetical protein
MLWRPPGWRRDKIFENRTPASTFVVPANVVHSNFCAGGYLPRDIVTSYAARLQIRAAASSFGRKLLW